MVAKDDGGSEESDVPVSSARLSLEPPSPSATGSVVLWHSRQVLQLWIIANGLQNLDIDPTLKLFSHRGEDAITLVL